MRTRRLNRGTLYQGRRAHTDAAPEAVAIASPPTELTHARKQGPPRCGLSQRICGILQGVRGSRRRSRNQPNLADLHFLALRRTVCSSYPRDLTVTIGGEVTQLVDIGVRLKGSGSFRTLDGKAAFLNFDHHVEGQLLNGLEKLALNNMVHDMQLDKGSKCP